MTRRIVPPRYGWLPFLDAAPGPAEEPSKIQARDCDKFYHPEAVVTPPMADRAP